MSKPISFRISEKDFNALKERATGTISDFVKSLVLDCLQGCKQEGETCIQAVYKDNDSCIQANCATCEKLQTVKKELEDEKLREVENEIKGIAEKYQQLLQTAEKEAKEWQETAEDWKKEGEAKIKAWASIALAVFFLFLVTLTFAIIK